MAAFIRRRIAADAKLFYEQQQRIATYIYKVDDSHTNFTKMQPSSKNPNFWHLRFPTTIFASNSNPSTCLFQYRGCSFIPKFFGPAFVRKFSGSSFGVTGDDVGDSLTEVLVDTSTVAPVVNELVLATAGSSYPVAMFETIIGSVHSCTGFTWWTSIAITTILFRISLIPLVINHLKATSKLNVAELKYDSVLDKFMRAADAEAVYESAAEIKEMHKIYGVKVFTPLKTPIIAGMGYIGLFLAAWNMAEKIPSFNNGGMLWFTDLSTPDSTYALPILSLVVCFTKYKFFPQSYGRRTTFDTVFTHVTAALQIAWIATLPKAILSYWITSDLYTICYYLVRHALIQRGVLVKEYEDNLVIVFSSVDTKGEKLMVCTVDKKTRQKKLIRFPNRKNGLSKEEIEKVVAEWRQNNEVSK